MPILHKITEIPNRTILISFFSEIERDNLLQFFHMRKWYQDPVFSKIGLLFWAQKKRNS